MKRIQFLLFPLFVLAIVLVFSQYANAYDMSDFTRAAKADAQNYANLEQQAISRQKEGVFGYYVLAVLAGALLGALCSQKFRPIRRYLFIAVVLLAAYINTILGIAAFFFMGFYVASLLLVDNTRRKYSTFGSAEWATFEELQNNELLDNKGLILGNYIDKKQIYPLHYTGNRHLLTVAPTRSGKGVSSIIPNLLTYEGSAIIIDPKGENARITAIRRGRGDEERKIKGLGQKVYIVDPWGITGFDVSCFNPLSWLIADDVDISENAMLLADSIITPRQGNSDPFWDDEAKALLMGIMLYVAIDEVEDNRHLGYVRDIIISSESVFKEVLQRMSESNNSIVQTTAERTAGKDPKLLSNILASLQSHTHFLDSPRIRQSLSKSDFNFESLKTENTTVYLVLPADRLDTFGRWLRILIQQAITVTARNIEYIPEKPILFMLDEMAALGRLTMVEQAYSLMAGFGMQLASPLV